MSTYEFVLIACALYSFFMALTVNTTNMVSAIYFKFVPFMVGLLILSAVFRPF